MKGRPLQLFEKLYAEIDSRSLRTPIIELPVKADVRLFVKREDLMHKEISGNKYWKLFFNVKEFLAADMSDPMLITFGGAYSNHIAAVAALGREIGVETLGIIRGDELAGKWQQNRTLATAAANGMSFRFVTRNEYRDKDTLATELKTEFPDALIVPEGGTNEQAVEGVRYMLDERTKVLDYLCCPVGTGGTIAGISKYAEPGQKAIGFKVVRDDSLAETVSKLSGKNNAELIDALFGGYGKFDEEHLHAVERMSKRFGIPLEPIYTGKMFRKLFELIDEEYFPPGAKILAFHTGGLQGFVKTENKE
ncbi:MAG: pyridoxal-phosphate dependent enzyme [Acidobacteria bacterium]|nr:pyridoxal-phosphate dependent enzyme [Acidobacteriota bacterium]